MRPVGTGATLSTSIPATSSRNTTLLRREVTSSDSAVEAGTRIGRSMASRAGSRIWTFGQQVSRGTGDTRYRSVCVIPNVQRLYGT
ncbi:hypothetical protein BD311DRAFT_746944 [Dichomitus squalens]|uniref:Uncharacterized protein n=1 Tax=Dichomitus squalens TaxID=114155 RepID=A0A4Q9N0N6_9APHY|nr:hypothetical protein BD311DRAFT_746944 [Dichomitus squalens]